MSIARGSPWCPRRGIAAAHELGYEIKLVGVAEIQDGAITARVYPAMLPKTHPLAAVRDVFNAVFVQGEEVGELMFFGRGAGARRRVRRRWRRRRDRSQPGHGGPCGGMYL